ERPGQARPGRARGDGGRGPARPVLRLARLLAELPAPAARRELRRRDAAGRVPRAALLRRRDGLLLERLVPVRLPRRPLPRGVGRVPEQAPRTEARPAPVRPAGPPARPARHDLRDRLRPSVAVAVDPTSGALLVADWGSGIVYAIQSTPQALAAPHTARRRAGILE